MKSKGNDPNARELIINLRGGTPPRCDFCGDEKPSDQLHPEEGGEWICNACIASIGYGGGGE